MTVVKNARVRGRLVSIENNAIKSSIILSPLQT